MGDDREVLVRRVRIEADSAARHVPGHAMEIFRHEKAQRVEVGVSRGPSNRGRVDRLKLDGA